MSSTVLDFVEQIFLDPPADDLELREQSGDSSVVTCTDLHPDTTWGPFHGILQSESNTADGETEVGARVSAHVLCPWAN